MNRSILRSFYDIYFKSSSGDLETIANYFKIHDVSIPFDFDVITNTFNTVRPAKRRFQYFFVILLLSRIAKYIYGMYSLISAGKTSETVLPVIWVTCYTFATVCYVNALRTDCDEFCIALNNWQNAKLRKLEIFLSIVSFKDVNLCNIYFN